MPRRNSKPDPKMLHPATAYDVRRFSEGYWSPLILDSEDNWYVGKRVKRTTILAVDDSGAVRRFRTYGAAYYAAARRDADDWLNKTGTAATA